MAVGRRDPKRILQALRDSALRAPDGLDRISILGRTPSGRASTLVLTGAGGSVRISADSFRFAVGRALGWNTLRSDRYQVQASGGRIAFEGSGSGHGVGLCQLGAEQMGADGRSYRDILAFYYPGTLVGLTGRGLSWQRLSGDLLTMLTTQPDQDRTVLATADRIEHAIAQRTHLAGSVEYRTANLPRPGYFSECDGGARLGGGAYRRPEDRFATQLGFAREGGTGHDLGA